MNDITTLGVIYQLSQHLSEELRNPLRDGLNAAAGNLTLPDGMTVSV
jgi:hypothetical protein